MVGNSESSSAGLTCPGYGRGAGTRVCVCVCVCARARTRAPAHPHARLREGGPHGDLLPHAHVGVAVPLEGGLQLLQLLAREVCALPPLLLLLGGVLRTSAARATGTAVLRPLGFPAALLL